MKSRRTTLHFAAIAGFLLFMHHSYADTAAQDPARLGVKIRFGGRYDNVRMCVASKAGAKGGIAADISAFVDLPVGNGTIVHIDLPVMRPILFAAAFKMLQFEPTVSLRFSHQGSSDIDFDFGPTLGASFHYGPDYTSEASGPGRTPSFFAMGPIIGAYAGVTFERPGKSFDFQLGLSPYVMPLFGIKDAQNHRGMVIGALLDGAFRFN